MRQFIIFLLPFVIASCDSLSTKTKGLQTQADTVQIKNDCKPYFVYDQVDHYFIDIKEGKLWEIQEKKKKTSNEQRLLNLLIQFTPEKLSDTIVFNAIEQLGFKKTTLTPDTHRQIGQIFCERKHENVALAACIAIYRDILVFKKNNKIIGVAKICFTCNLSTIIGTNCNTEEFGQSGDYEKLRDILYRKT